MSTFTLRLLLELGHIVNGGSEGGSNGGSACRPDGGSDQAAISQFDDKDDLFGEQGNDYLHYGNGDERKN